MTRYINQRNPFRTLPFSLSYRGRLRVVAVLQIEVETETNMCSFVTWVKKKNNVCREEESLLTERLTVFNR
jgi:hypothetical protein